MAITNRDRFGKALEILGDGLAPFVERELKSVLATKWQEALIRAGRTRGTSRQEEVL